MLSLNFIVLGLLQGKCSKKSEKSLQHCAGDVSLQRILFYYLILIEESKEEVASYPLVVHILGITYGVFVGIGHFATLVDIAQNLALAIAHSAIGVDVANALAGSVVDLQTFHLAHNLAGLVAHSAIVVKKTNGLRVGIAHNAVGRNATYVVIAGIAKSLGLHVRGANCCECQ